MILTILHLLVNTKTLILALDHTYEVTNGMTIPLLNNYTYAQMDVFSCYILCHCLSSSVFRVIFQQMRLLKNLFPVSRPRMYSFS